MLDEEDCDTPADVPEYQKSLLAYYSSGVLPQTRSPRSLSYKHLICGPAGCTTPALLVELINYLNVRVPPLTNLQYGMNKRSLYAAEDLLSSMIKINGDENHIQYLTASLPAGVIVQMIQILLLRFEQPAFFSTADFCEYIQKKIFMISPRQGMCRGNHRRWCTGRKVASRCMTRMSRQQQAASLTLIKTCQRWSQEHLAYRLRENPKSDSIIEYTEGVCLLSSLFATSLIGIPKSYVAKRRIGDDYGALANLKMIMFIFLMCMVTYDEWHMHEQKAIQLEETGEYDEKNDMTRRRSTSYECTIDHKLSASSDSSVRTPPENSTELRTKKILSFQEK